MHTRTLDVALWDYLDVAGKIRRAFYRQQLNVTDAELNRGEAAAVFAPEAEPDDRPPRTATRAVLLEWLTSRGVDPDSTKDLNKPKLWARIEAAMNALPSTELE